MNGPCEGPLFGVLFFFGCTRPNISRFFSTLMQFFSKLDRLQLLMLKYKTTIV
uniref:Uncharacterized protein n=1 Tax=Anguilla anguilla TaxID=7936 RepID=A0A0E9WUX0_ANGAN